MRKQQQIEAVVIMIISIVITALAAEMIEFKDKLDDQKDQIEQLIQLKDNLIEDYFRGLDYVVTWNDLVHCDQASIHPYNFIQLESSPRSYTVEEFVELYNLVYRIGPDKYCGPSEQRETASEPAR